MSSPIKILDAYKSISNNKTYSSHSDVLSIPKNNNRKV